MREGRSKYLYYSLVIWLGLAYLTNAQIPSCPLITISDLGSTTEFSTDGLIAWAIVPPAELGSVTVRIMDFSIVCDTSGDRINTSSYVSVVVQLQCNSQSSNPSLEECDGSTIDTRQYQFQCIEKNGQPTWDNIADGTSLFVQTLDPTATLSTPLANQCRRCIDDRQSMRPGLDPITHCDPCPSQCDQGQGRCYIGLDGNECCNFYLQGNCVNNCSSTFKLVADSNFNCVCPELTLGNGTVRYSDEGGSVVRNIGSVATHTCEPGFRLLEGPDTVAQQNTRTCSTGGWSNPGFTCERIICPDLSIMNGVVGTSPPGRVFMSRTIYICNDGFALKGDGNRVCQVDSMWNGTDPECADCSAALQDPNCVECGFDLIMPLCVMCKPGYKVRNGQCETEEQIICPDLTIVNGVVGTSPPGRVFMSRTIYTCNDGFALKGDGNRVCQIDSMWNGTDPECVPILRPTPVIVQGLCSVVLWYSPEVPCSEVSGYDVRLYSPQSGQQNVTRRVGANGTFYIIKDEDILAGSGETYVQVRIIHNGREAEWSEGISLGCEKPTVSEIPRVYFMLAEKVYRNNSVIPLTEVGEGDNALLCKTDKEECCGTVPNRFGEFYYPSGVQVPIANRRQGFYRNRGDQIIRLNRREGITSSTGTYRCEIPNADDVIVTIYVTLTGN